MKERKRAGDKNKVKIRTLESKQALQLWVSWEPVLAAFQWQRKESGDRGRKGSPGPPSSLTQQTKTPRCSSLSPGVNRERHFPKDLRSGHFLSESWNSMEREKVLCPENV